MMVLPQWRMAIEREETPNRLPDPHSLSQSQPKPKPEAEAVDDEVYYKRPTRRTEQIKGRSVQ